MRLIYVLEFVQKLAFVLALRLVYVRRGARLVGMEVLYDQFV